MLPGRPKVIGMRAARERVRTLVESKPFQRSIIVLIVLNAVILGLETYPVIVNVAGDFLGIVNAVIIGIFVVEISLRIFAHGLAFFRNGWNLFDLFVVIVALIPAGSEAGVLRVLRLLRVMRLLSAVRSMRLVVTALGASMPGIASIGALLFMLIYVFSVAATTLFGEQNPDHFGDLWVSGASLFRIMFGDGWPDFVAPMAFDAPWIWGFFIVFTIAASLIVLNLLIAVVVEAMDRMKIEEIDDAIEKDMAIDERILEELAALREQVARLEAATTRRGGG
jgi:voltage-gated sodium channel